MLREDMWVRIVRARGMFFVMFVGVPGVIVGEVLFWESLDLGLRRPSRRVV